MKHEHIIDTWNRLGINYNILKEEEDGFWYNHFKPGNKSWSRVYFAINPATELNRCRNCNKLSTPKKVCERNLPYSPGPDKLIFPSMLCMGCWNKLRPIAKASIEADDMRILNNRLIREYRKWQRSQTPAN